MLTGNRGEWSEFYVFLKLLADGKLSAADENLNKLKGVFYRIIEIVVNDDNILKRYSRRDDLNVEIFVVKDEGYCIKISDFKRYSKLVLEKIKSSSGSFSIEEVTHFMDMIHVSKLKQGGGQKKDIQILVHDPVIPGDVSLGFSIKSHLGSNPTLLNASGETAFRYKLSGDAMIDVLMEEVNSITGQGRIKKRLACLIERKVKILPATIRGIHFHGNLQLVDSFMPQMMASLILLYYSGEGNSVADLCNHLTKRNPCHYEMLFRQDQYSYKIKKLLAEIALGMIPGQSWNGIYNATGGYIVVKEDGEILCYHVYNRNEFENYLFNNTYFDTPSSGKHKFGTVYKEESNYFWDLNFQIRFKH